MPSKNTQHRHKYYTYEWKSGVTGRGRAEVATTWATTSSGRLDKEASLARTLSRGTMRRETSEEAQMYAHMAGSAQRHITTEHKNMGCKDTV